MNTLEQRCLNYMNAYKAPREEFFQHLWDSVVCPKELAQKALTHAGLPFDKIWTLNARVNTAEAKDRVNQYLASIP